LPLVTECAGAFGRSANHSLQVDFGVDNVVDAALLVGNHRPSFLPAAPATISK